MDKRNWQIIYSNYEGPEKKAVELIYKEVGAQILRDPKVYTFHTLACHKVGASEISKNSIIIGRYDENELIAKYIKRDEVPADGYLVKVTDCPENPELKLVLITGIGAVEVFYGAVDFVDDYMSGNAFVRSELVFFDETMANPLPDYYNASKPAIKSRNIFTWGQPISDYMEYIDNMARLRFNELIIWNDYAPINAKDIVNYAHEYGIRLIWGFAWGWSRHCEAFDLNSMDTLIGQIIKKYEEEYADTGADGIYFQAFTEQRQEYMGDRLIADVVTKFVNATAEKLLERHPGLLIQFGLHATSVKNHLEFIKNVDKRVDIIWEDCGDTFPYLIDPFLNDADEYKKAKEFTKKIIGLRGDGKDGVLYKCHLILDWFGDNFVHQTGPYVLGQMAKRTRENDREMIKPLWKKFQNGWLDHGKLAYDLTREIVSVGNKRASIGLASQLANGRWFPYSLVSQILWECDKPYDEILMKVLNRRSVDMV